MWNTVRTWAAEYGNNQPTRWKGKSRRGEKKKAIIHQTSRGDLQTGRQGQMGTKLVLFAKKEKKKESDCEALVYG